MRALRAAQARRVTQYVVPVVFPRINPLNLRLLHSRLHSLLSWYVLVFRFEGRRTGRRYEVPATYRRAPDGALEVLTSTRRGWWRNLDGNAGVTILYRGQLRSVRVEVVRTDGSAPAGEREEAIRRALASRDPILRAVMPAPVGGDGSVAYLARRGRPVARWGRGWEN